MSSRDSLPGDRDQATKHFSESIRFSAPAKSAYICQLGKIEIEYRADHKRRLLMSVNDCVILEDPAATVWCDRCIPDAAQRRIAADPGRLIRAAAAYPLKISPETLVLRTELPLDGKMVPVVVKQYRPQTCWKALAAMFRESKAAANWSKASLLRAHGVATPQPLLACCERGWPARGRSFLVSEWLAGENLHVFGWRIKKLTSDARHRLAAECADQLGRLIGRMHASGATHRDLKAANLLVVEGEPKLQTWLVDLDGLRFGRQVNFPQQARDLARLAAGLAAHPWVSRTICRRFLRAYCSELTDTTIAWKELWRAIAARATQIIARKRRRGKEVL
jgi:tRNA A-37 threonylcarbamoyl transferase component Bud32